MRSAALYIPAIDRPAEKGATTSARERAEGASTDQVGKGTAAKSADNQARRSVIALAIGPAILASIDAIIATQPTLTVVSASIAACGVPIAAVAIALPTSVVAVATSAAAIAIAVIMTI